MIRTPQRHAIEPCASTGDRADQVRRAGWVHLGMTTCAQRAVRVRDQRASRRRRFTEPPSAGHLPHESLEVRSEFLPAGGPHFIECHQRAPWELPPDRCSWTYLRALPGCVRPSAATTLHGRGQRTREGVEVTAVFVHEGRASPRNVCPPGSPTARGGPVRETVEEADRSGGRVGATGRSPRPTISCLVAPSLWRLREHETVACPKGLRPGRCTHSAGCRRTGIGQPCGNQRVQHTVLPIRSQSNHRVGGRTADGWPTERARSSGKWNSVRSRNRAVHHPRPRPKLGQ